MPNILHQKAAYATNTEKDQKDLAKLIARNTNLIDTQDSDGDTLLHLFATYDYDVVKYVINALIKHGANPFIKNKKGFTPKMMAAVPDAYNRDEDEDRDEYYIDTYEADDQHVSRNRLYELLSAYEDSYRAKETAKALQGLSLLVSLQANNESHPSIDLIKKRNTAVTLINQATNALLGSRQMGD